MGQEAGAVFCVEVTAPQHRLRKSQSGQTSERRFIAASGQRSQRYCASHLCRGRHWISGSPGSVRHWLMVSVLGAVFCVSVVLLFR
jgi:hypothetical protein